MALAALTPGCASQRLTQVEHSLDQVSRDLYALSKADTELDIKLDELTAQVELLRKRVQQSDERLAVLVDKVSQLSTSGSLSVPGQSLYAPPGSRGSPAPEASPPPAAPPKVAKPPESARIPPSPTPAAGEAAPPSDRPDELYQKAYAAYNANNYPQAILAFEEFIARYPQSEFVDNARYWIGESYYGQHDYRSAAAQFERVFKDYPQGNKVPDALLKLAFCYYELQEYERAITELQRVVERFPQSAAAEKAKRKLQQVESER